MLETFDLYVSNIPQGSSEMLLQKDCESQTEQDSGY